MPVVYYVADDAGGIVSFFPTKKEAVQFARSEGHPRDGIGEVSYEKNKEGITRLLNTWGEKQ